MHRAAARIATAFALALLIAALAQAWPGKPAKIAVPFAAGGPAGICTRALAQEQARRHGRREVRLHVFGFNEAAIALCRDTGCQFIDRLMRKPL
jgi:hypothetical protein